MATISLRLAETFDIPAIAQIGSQAFLEEPIYDHFFPLRSVYPQDYYQYFVDDARKVLCSPGQIIVVAELDENTCTVQSDVSLGAKQKIVGYATFIRTGTKAELASWNPDSTLKKVLRSLLWLKSLYKGIFAQNRAISPSTIRNYYGQAELVHAEYLKESKSKIDFKTLAVDVSHQRQGVGEKLVEWCGLRAWEDDVPVFGDASTKGLPLYLRNGCEEIGRIRLPTQVVPQKDGFESNEIAPLEVVVLRWKA